MTCPHCRTPPHYHQETGSGQSQHTLGWADHLSMASHLNSPRCWKVLLIRNPPFCHLPTGLGLPFGIREDLYGSFCEYVKMGIKSLVTFYGSQPGALVCHQSDSLLGLSSQRSHFHCRVSKICFSLQRLTPYLPHLSPCFWGNQV